MLVLYIILVVSTLAVIGVGLAFYVRVKRHMKGPGETQRREAFTGATQPPPAGVRDQK